MVSKREKSNNAIAILEKLPFQKLIRILMVAIISSPTVHLDYADYLDIDGMFIFYFIVSSATFLKHCLPTIQRE